MPRLIAFLRAINVGGHTVKMDALRQLFVAQGFNQVETFIASGNVIFDTAAADLSVLENAIETYLNEALGYAVKTFLRTSTSLAAIVRSQPFPAADLAEPANTMYVGFLQAPPGAETIQKVQALANPLNEFRLQDRELYWLIHTPLSQSTITGARLEKTLGMPTTLRNLNTLQRLVTLNPVG